MRKTYTFNKYFIMENTRINPKLSAEIVKYYFINRDDNDDEIKPIIPFDEYKNITFIQLIDDAFKSIEGRKSIAFQMDLHALLNDYKNVNNNKLRREYNNIIDGIIWSHLHYNDSDIVISNNLNYVKNHVYELSIMSILGYNDINMNNVRKTLSKYVPLLMLFQVEYGYIYTNNTNISISNPYAECGRCIKLIDEMLSLFTLKCDEKTDDIELILFDLKLDLETLRTELS